MFYISGVVFQGTQTWSAKKNEKTLHVVAAAFALCAALQRRSLCTQSIWQTSSHAALTATNIIMSSLSSWKIGTIPYDGRLDGTIPYDAGSVRNATVHNGFSDHTAAPHAQATREAQHRPPATAKKVDKKKRRPQWLAELNVGRQKKTPTHERLKALARQYYDHGKGKERFMNGEVGATHGWIRTEEGMSDGGIVRSFYPFVGWLPIYKDESMMFDEDPTLERNSLGYDSEITAKSFIGDGTWALTWDTSTKEIEDTLPTGWTMTQHEPGMFEHQLEDETPKSTVITRNTLEWDTNDPRFINYGLLYITDAAHTPTDARNPNLLQRSKNTIYVTQETWNKADALEKTAIEKKWTVYVEHEEFAVDDHI